MVPILTLFELLRFWATTMNMTNSEAIKYTKAGGHNERMLENLNIIILIIFN
jgi:hypothetical protein